MDTRDMVTQEIPAPARGRPTLRRKVVLATVVALAVPTLAAAALVYRFERDNRQQEVFDSLSAVATVQEHRVEAFLASNREMLSALSGRVQLQVSLAGIIDTDDQRAELWANALLSDALRGSTTLHAISVVDLDGTVLASTEEALRRRPFPLDPTAMIDVAAAGPRVTIAERDGRELVLSAGPVELASRRLGTVIIERSASTLLSGIVDYTGLGETGETLLAERTPGGATRFLAPVRDDDADAPRTGDVVDAETTDVPLEALDAEERILTDLEDYRGEEVVAATQYVPEADWAIVVKMDEGEALASIARLRTMLMVALVAALVGAAALSGILTRSLLRPFAELNRMAQAVLRGERHDPARVAGNDERATVAQALNRMTDDLVSANQHLESRLAALQVSEERRRGTIESAHDPYVEIDGDGTITAWNTQATATFGWTADEAVGSPLHEILIPAAHREAHLNGLARVRAGMASRILGTPVELTSLHRDGHEIPVELTVWRTDTVGGVRFHAFIRDITERREATARLEMRVAERTRQLEDTNRELQAFTYSVSHDLRAPLRAIDGFSQAVLEDNGNRLDEAGRAHLERVRAGAQRMGGLIDDLMELSRLSRSEVRRQTIDLCDVASEITEELREGEPDRDVRVRIDDDLSVQADPGLMSVALRNLLGNAWKFTRDREDAEIEVTLVGANGTRAFAVRDNGAGFDPEYSSELFRPFGRLHRADEFPGTGIGLATVERVVHLHGGHVWAEGAPDEGAAFYFTLDDDREEQP